MVFSNFLTNALQKQIVGQGHAVAALSRAVTLALTGMFYKNRPLAVLLFLGPAGSGKTHAARSLTHVLLGSERNMIYVDCQRLDHNTNLLAEATEQLVMGYWRSQTGLPRRPPFSIVVFEDVDKAAPAFRDNLAAAISRGEIFTPGGFFSLRNSFIILTSNLSKRRADQLIGRTIGFFRNDLTVDGAGLPLSRQHLAVLEEMDTLIGAHLVSRIDEIILFEELNEQNVITLLERRLLETETHLAGFHIGLIIDRDAKTFLLSHSLEDLTHGMRQINRIVRNYLEFPLADLILSQRLSPGTTVMVKYESPQNFLNYQIMIPRFTSAQTPLMKPQEVMTEAID
ncbi:MAG: AAA family ATPase [Blastocatellia bacterium]|nr:AAA family ATPase [Blastocatellia bacterium]